MRINFWIKTWDKGNIGFHLHEIHPTLKKHWPRSATSSTALVPLCGKSRDLLWLEAQGHEVIGVDFVETAVLDFFRENKLAWGETTQYGHRCFRAHERNIYLFVADFIQFADDYDGPAMDSLYDRAALVALPHNMRAGYVTACKKLLAPKHQGLLLTIEYDQDLMEGPPFSVTAAEVERLWESQLVLVESEDVLASMPRALASGVPSLHEYCWVFR